MMAVPMLLYGSKCLTKRERDMQKLGTAEMRFLRSVRGGTRLDEVRNECIRKELRVFSVNDRIRRYRQDWLEHVERIEEG
jgi:hypothetical protein